ASPSASTGWWAAPMGRSWPRSTRCPPSCGTRRSCSSSVSTPRRRSPSASCSVSFRSPSPCWRASGRGARRCWGSRARSGRTVRRPSPRRRRPGCGSRGAGGAVQGLSVTALLLAWECVARAGWVDPLFVPAPSAVLGAFGRIGRAALAGLGDTLLKTAIAYVLAVVIGVGGGLLLGAVRPLRRAVNPFVIALYGMPKILVLPWIVLSLGFGATPAVVYATIHGAFPILVLVTGAVRDVDRNLVTVARAFGARRWQLYWKVVLPAIVPTVLAGMRLGIVFCL